MRGVDAAFSRTFEGIDRHHIDEAAQLLWQAALIAAEQVHGRQLFAAFVALDWQTQLIPCCSTRTHDLLREFRGDGHIAALLSHGLAGIDALVLHVTMTPALSGILKRSRQWTGAEWTQAEDRLIADG